MAHELGAPDNRRLKKAADLRHDRPNYLTFSQTDEQGVSRARPWPPL